MLKVTYNEAAKQVKPHKQNKKEENENEVGDEFMVIWKQIHGDAGA